MKPINKLLIILMTTAIIMLSIAFYGIVNAATLCCDYPGIEQWNIIDGNYWKLK